MTSQVVLVDTNLIDFIKSNEFVSESGNLMDFIQPTSLDIPISSECYLMKNKFLPNQRIIRDMVKETKIRGISLQQVLLKNQTYLIYCGKIHLHSNHRAIFSPKSSIGRIDVMVRVIVDNCGFYDHINFGKQGEVWCEVSPKSFNVSLNPGMTLTQMMIFEEQNLKQEIREQNLKQTITSLKVYPKMENREFLNSCTVLSLCIRNGYEALNTNQVVNFIEKSNKIENFFHKIESKENYIILEKDKFYIFSTKERLEIDNMTCAEMLPFSHHIGELRTHYAGFFDSGFGVKDKGTVAVLEVRVHETIKVFDGQPIALMQCFRNKSIPQKLYGMCKNHYQEQDGPQLAKYFI